MGQLISKQDVTALLQDTTVDVSSAITKAVVLTDDRLSGHSISDTVMKQIQANLAAHYYCTSGIAPSQSSIQRIKDGQTEITYQPVNRSRNEQSNAGLRSTKFGLDAIDFDPTGILAGLGRKRATFAME